VDEPNQSDIFKSNLAVFLDYTRSPNDRSATPLNSSKLKCRRAEISVPPPANVWKLK